MSAEASPPLGFLDAFYKDSNPDEKKNRIKIVRAFLNFLLVNGYSVLRAEARFGGFLKMWDNIRKHSELHAINTEAFHNLLGFLSGGGFGDEGTALELFERLAAEHKSVDHILRELKGLHAVSANEAMEPGQKIVPCNLNYAGDVVTNALLELMDPLKAVLGDCVFAPTYRLPREDGCSSILSLLMSLVLPAHRTPDGKDLCRAAVKAIATQAKHLLCEGGCSQLEALKAVLGNGEGSEDLLTFKRVVLTIVEIAQKVVDENPELVAMWKEMDVLDATLGV